MTKLYHRIFVARTEQSGVREQYAEAWQSSQALPVKQSKITQRNRDDAVSSQNEIAPGSDEKASGEIWKQSIVFKAITIRWNLRSMYSKYG